MHKPNLGVDPMLVQQRGQGLIHQNAGRIDQKRMALAELLKRGGAMPGASQGGQSEKPNRMLQQFIAQRLMAG